MEQKLTLKKYKIVNKISEGNFGTVYKAINTETQQIVALKKLFASCQNKKFRSQCEREIAILSQINHPNIVKLFEYKLKETSITLVLEYVEYDLQQFLTYTVQQSTKLITYQIKSIIYQILAGVNAIHEKLFIHRDLKPSNIMLTSEGIIKIADFGSAIALDDKINNLFEIEGFTRWYKAPEILFGCRFYSQGIDIWQCACIFAEILNGYPLFPGINEIEQISRIANILGSPNEKNWENLTEMPDFGKIIFVEKEKKDLKEVLNNASAQELQFIQCFLKYGKRPTAKEVILIQHIINKQLLENKYFQSDQQMQLIFQCNLPKRELDDSDFTYFNLIKN